MARATQIMIQTHTLQIYQVGLWSTVNNDVLAPPIKHDKTRHFSSDGRQIETNCMCFSVFSVRLGITVNNDALALGGKSRENMTPCVIFARFCNKMHMFLCGFTQGSKPPQIMRFLQRLRKHENTRYFCSELGANWQQWPCFSDVFCRAAEHRK